MGYDSRIYVIRKYDGLVDDKGHKYAEIIAVYEMCKFPPFQKLFGEDSKCSDTKHYIYEGDDAITADMYGESLKETTIETVLECLDQESVLNNDIAPYRRIAPLKAMLEALNKNKNSWGELAILHYGH